MHAIQEYWATFLAQNLFIVDFADLPGVGPLKFYHTPETRSGWDDPGAFDSLVVLVWHVAENAIMCCYLETDDDRQVIKITCGLNMDQMKLRLNFSNTNTQEAEQSVCTRELSVSWRLQIWRHRM